MERVENGRVSAQRILQELQAIGFASATDYMSVEDNTLVIRSTGELTRQQAASIAAIERTSNGIKVKFYDKLKALELLGKQVGLFEGEEAKTQTGNNLLEAIVASTGEVIHTDDIPEIQQAAKPGHDLVEPSGA